MLKLEFSASNAAQRIMGQYRIMCISANNEELEFLKSTIKSVPDYPKKGILFRDITSLIENPRAFSMVIDMLAQHYREKGITKIVGTEARGFIFAAPLAIALNVAFVPIRKPGKLPRAVLQEEYELEYGTDKLEIHQDAIVAGDQVLVIDDLLATGGTAVASVNLVRRLGGIVQHAGFVINLPGLKGAQHLLDIDVTPFSLVDFAGS